MSKYLHLFESCLSFLIRETTIVFIAKCQLFDQDVSLKRLQRCLCVILQYFINIKHCGMYIIVISDTTCGVISMGAWMPVQTIFSYAISTRNIFKANLFTDLFMLMLNSLFSTLLINILDENHHEYGVSQCLPLCRQLRYPHFTKNQVQK